MRLVRVDDHGLQHLASCIHHGTLHAIAVPRIQPQGGPLTGRSGQQHITQVLGKHLQRACLGFLLQPHPHIQPRGHIELGAPAPAHGVVKPGVSSINTCTIRDKPLIECVIPGIEMQVQHAFLFSAQQSQNAVRRQRLKGLRKLEIILELSAFLFLTFRDGGGHAAATQHFLANLPHQVSVGGTAIHQDSASSLQYLLLILETLTHVRGGGGGGIG